MFSDLAKNMLHKSCELFSFERQVTFSIPSLCSVSHDFNTCRGEKKKPFLNLWSMASSVLTVNWVFLGEWSESGSAEMTARNDNTRLDQHLPPPKTSTVRQVLPIFLLFLPASFQMVPWDKHSCWKISLYPYTTPEAVLGERMPTNAMHTCCQILLKRIQQEQPVQQEQPSPGYLCLPAQSSGLKKVMIPESTPSE